MSSGLVLSLFSGLGVLDEGFRSEGFRVVSAGDLIWGSLYDLRRFHPPAGVFDGIIGGDPCQSHSTLANLVRAKGLEPRFPDLTPEFKRVVEEARPAWFLRENVPSAPELKPDGYDVRGFLLDHSTLDRGDGTGHEQMRRRRFWFGVRDGACPELRAHIDFALFELPDAAHAVDAGHDYIDAQRGGLRRVPVKLGGSGKVKSPAASCDGRQGHRINDGTGQFRGTKQPTVDGHAQHNELAQFRQPKSASVTTCHDGEIGQTGGHKGNAPRYSLAEMLELQGLPTDLLDEAPFTMQGKRKLVGNAVPLPMAKALARAVRLVRA